jgi:PTS system fructose-specific IIC component
MTGVSYMIPFVTAGGILIALSFVISGDPAGFTSLGVQNAFDGTDAAGVALDMNVRIGAFFFGLAMGPWGFLLPVLAGFIAYGIADRPGLVPGFAAGSVAGGIGSGFLGALVGGLVAGLVARWISNWNVPAALRSLMPIVVNPLLSTIATLTVMYVAVKNIVTPLNTGATDWLNGLAGGGGSLILLGIVLGLMMAFDMGGPINKVAYVFGSAGIINAAEAGVTPDSAGNGAYIAMAIVMASGMTPPLGLALATVLRKNLFTESEIENGKAAWVLGLTFITEGAIPFAAADPIRVIPSIMVGSAAAGATVAVFASTLNAPHGGIAVLPLIGNPLGFVVALLVGTVVTAFAVIAAKGMGAKANA